jgi:hypothetical protein
MTLVIFLITTLVACSSSATPAPTQSVPSTAPPTTGALIQPSTPNSSTPSQGIRANGTITNIDDNILTLNTPRGQITVNVGSNTTIQKIITGTLADLQTGQFLTVIGNADSSGNIVASSVIVRSQNPNSRFTPLTGATPNPGGPNRPNGSSFPRTVPSGIGNSILGTLADMNDNTLTLTTGQGQKVTVTVSSNTNIQKTVSGTISDLQIGESLTVMGNQDTNGNINAFSVTIRSEGAPPSGT